MKQGQNDGNGRDLRAIMRTLVGTEGKDIPAMIMCQVTAVNEDERSCTCLPINDKSIGEIPDVQLMAVPNDGELRLPAVDSYVIVCRMEKMQPFVIRESDLSKYVLYADEINLNGTINGGLVNIYQLTAKLNTLVTQLQANFTAISTTYPYTIVPLQPFSATDYQNTTIKHGNG